MNSPWSLFSDVNIYSFKQVNNADQAVTTHNLSLLIILWLVKSISPAWPGRWSEAAVRQHAPVLLCRHEGDGVHTCGDGGGPGARRDTVLQRGQRDRVLLRHQPAERRLSQRGLALGRLLRWHPLRDVIQQEVPGCAHEEHNRQEWEWAGGNEPAQQRGWEAGTWRHAGAGAIACLVLVTK